MSTVYGSYLYDSSVVLAHIFSESRFKNRIKKIQGDVKLLHIDYFVTPSIIVECKKRINLVGKFVLETVKQLNKSIIYYKDPKTQDPEVLLNEKDLPIFMEFFARSQADLSRRQAPISEKESLEYIETWIVTQLERDLSATGGISARQFFVKCVTEATTLSTNWMADLSRFTSRIVTQTLDASILERVRTSLASIQNYADKTNIAEAEQYRRSQKNMVFVALDYRDLVNNAQMIEKAIGMKVADPLYALTILRSIT